MVRHCKGFGKMNIAILGAGTVGGALGFRLKAAGHQIVYGVRDTENPKYQPLLEWGATLAKIPDLATQSEIIILTTPWNATQDALTQFGDFAGKILIDATNPIGPGFVLTHGHSDSGGEQVQRWARNANVVKAFNTTGVENMRDPGFGDSQASMFVCGDDARACETTKQLAADIGFDTMVVGKLSKARLLEPLAILWIGMSMQPDHGRRFAFALLRK
jgi:8-hydroxy-5-deazaflavin:NADPH oxidoreductase